MDTFIEPVCWGEFYITWMDASIHPQIKSLFQCLSYKEPVNIFKVVFSVLKTIVWEGRHRASLFFISWELHIKQTTFVRNNLWFFTCQPSKLDSWGSSWSLIIISKKNSVTPSLQDILKTRGGMDAIKRIAWLAELWFLVTSEMKQTQVTG